MIDKDKRCYIGNWFTDIQEFNEGDVLDFEMPPFCSGDYSTPIYLDTDGDPYIHKDEEYFKGCRNYYIIPKD